MTSGDPERVELSLQAAEGLLRKNTIATREVKSHSLACFLWHACFTVSQRNNLINCLEDKIR